MVKKPFLEYFLYVLQQYTETRKQNNPTTVYRLVDVKEKKDNQYELSFQFIGKAAIFQASPEEILKNDKIIEYFSSKDISIITQLACKIANKPKNIIVEKTFSGKLNKLLFKIRNLNNNIITERRASELSVDQQFIKTLSPEDAHMIGYVTAQEKQEEEQSFIKNLKKYSSALKEKL